MSYCCIYRTGCSIEKVGLPHFKAQRCLPESLHRRYGGNGNRTFLWSAKGHCGVVNCYFCPTDGAAEIVIAPSSFLVRRLRKSTSSHSNKPNTNVTLHAVCVGNMLPIFCQRLRVTCHPCPMRTVSPLSFHFLHISPANHLPSLSVTPPPDKMLPKARCQRLEKAK